MGTDPVGEGCSIRRAGPKPSAGEPGEDLVDVDVERQQEEPDARRAGRGRPRADRHRRGRLRAAPSKVTSSTTPESGWAGSPRKIERSVVEGASKSVGQSPSKTWSMRTSRPMPSR